MFHLFHKKRQPRLHVTALGLLALYGVAVTTYTLTLSPTLRFFGGKDQSALERSIHLEYTLREMAGYREQDAEFLVTLRRDQEHPAETDLYVQRTGTQYPFTSVLDVYSSHYHPAEMRNGTMFVIRRIDDPDGTWVDQDGSIYGFRDELWAYDISGKGEKVFEYPGIDFRASVDGEYIVVSEGPSQIAMVSKHADVLHHFRWPELAGDLRSMIQEKMEVVQAPPSIGFSGWSNDGKYFWGWMGWLKPEMYFRINAERNIVRTFDVSDMPLGSEVAFNPNSGKFAYTNYPFMFDSISKETFETTNTPVTLVLHDLMENESLEISSSVAMPFSPSWIGTENFEYTHPYTRERVIFTVK
ncbi:MAG: hypothetical protein O2904_03615 [bacterium]|nr:hypothetical protein [bacterium]